MMSKKSKDWMTSKMAAAEREEDGSSTLPGWPGYRTSAGRSGLDPIDSQTEAGHVSGVLIRQLFTLQIKTKKPIQLILLAIIGLLLVLPFLAVVSDTVRGNSKDAIIWIIFILPGITGLAAFANLVKNLIRH
jgi:hypothetical protein